MPKLVVTYKNGHTESERYDTGYDARESGECRLTWDDVEKVEVFDNYGDLRAWAYNHDEVDE